MSPDGLRSRASSATVAIIPARYHSTRFPGKPLADLAGRPMIEHVYRRTASCRAVNAVIVATDDTRIAEAVNRFGGHAVVTSASHRTGTERLAEVAAGLDATLVVNVQGDEPLIVPEMIEEAIKPLAADPAIVMSTLRRPLTAADLTNPHVVKVVVDREGFALYFSRAALPYGHDREDHLRPDLASKHVGLYVYRREFLLTLAALPPTPLEQAESLEQLRALEHGYRIRVVETAHDTVGVDTPEDLERVRQHLLAAPLVR